MNEKTIIVDNPIGLPLASIDDFVLFQGDMKLPITDEALQNLKTSIRDHHVFIGKAVAKFNGELLTEDGHQTLAALKSLRDDDGYAGSRVILYTDDGQNMVEDGVIEYADIMIPYQLIVPQGTTDEAKRKDAAAKIAIINSQYAVPNPETTFFSDLKFDADDLAKLLGETVMPVLSCTDFGLSFLDEEKDVEFKEYDESVADSVEVCTCPTCGHEHAKK